MKIAKYLLAALVAAAFVAPRPASAGVGAMMVPKTFSRDAAVHSGPFEGAIQLAAVRGAARPAFRAPAPRPTFRAPVQRRTFAAPRPAFRPAPRVSRAATPQPSRQVYRGAPVRSRAAGPSAARPLSNGQFVAGRPEHAPT